MSPASGKAPAAQAGRSSQSSRGGGGSGEGERGRGGGDPAGRRSKPAAQAWRRTKTGCLTCRKRRIKCDEGKPTCNNCIKSKRACEGYNQRVVFKDPVGAHTSQTSLDPYAYRSATSHDLSEAASLRGRLPGQAPLAMIAPKPPQTDYSWQRGGMQYGPPSAPGLPGHGHYVHPDLSTHSVPHGRSYEQGNTAHAPAGSAPIPGSSQMAQPSGSSDQPRADKTQPYPSPEAAGPPFYAEPDPSTGWPSDGPEVTPGPSSHPQAHEQHQTSDEDASMYDSSDGEERSSRALMAPVFSGIFGHDARDATFRTFSSFAHSDAVGQYMTSPHATELRDDAKRKLFEHFMRVTGPTMSLYERRPFDPANDGIGSSIAGATSNIWSYTFPLISFQNPALLHAMLALASLQVSKLQDAPATAAHKHYHIALRRIAKNVGSDIRRLQPANIAATLLLSYFEVWNSEHSKWCSHLYGTRTLFAEMPMRAMSKRFLPVRSLKERQKIMRKLGLAGIGGPLPKDPDALDFDLLSTITGYHVKEEDYGLNDGGFLRNVDSSVTEKELESFENIRDLYWWFCKMDAYQAVLGGARPFMEYGTWTQCLPRAPMSRLDNAYGTYDHLMLLFGRLATFTEKDLARKRRVSRPSAPPAAGNPSPPNFPGMVPVNDTVRPPMGFSPPRKSNHQHVPTEDQSDQEMYREALAEWEGIRHALEVFEGRLGPEFHALSPEYTDGGDHPFGQALQYRTYPVAGIWMNYYSALISLYRSHPDMPPAAMQAAGASGHKTAVYANNIGRISVGLSDDLAAVTDISTALAAALLESSFCLFVAGIQYRDEVQRTWVIQRLHDVTRLTGWQTAKQIADGCESTWTRAAKMGRGPPYVRSPDMRLADGSTSDSSHRLHRRIQKVKQHNGEEMRVVIARTDRAHYALGLLGVDDDFEKLELKDDAFHQMAAEG